MVITKTPFRMSFFGGGTDFSSFYSKHGGAVLSSTFDKYCYVNVRHLPPFFDYRTELAYSKTERISSVDEIQHPAIREAMKHFKIQDLRLTYEADLPARSGLGTSSAFAVGMLNAFHVLKGRYVDKRTLADQAIYLERTLCQESGGIQDQIAASFGGFNRIDFSESGYTVRPVLISQKRKRELNDNLMLFFTGFSRFSSDIQKSTEKSIVSTQSVDHLLRMKALVGQAEEILCSETHDLGDFGRLMDETWKLKRGLGDGVSTDTIDDYYGRAMKAGALGGKLLGAGGGGFFVFYVEKDHQIDVSRALSNLLEVPFEFESSGTQVIHYTPEDDGRLRNSP